MPCRVYLTDGRELVIANDYEEVVGLVSAGWTGSLDFNDAARTRRSFEVRQVSAVEPIPDADNPGGNLNRS